jgi:type I restriction enzyme, S subunit
MAPSDWLHRTVGDLVTLQRGIDLPDAERREGRIPIMGSFGITGRHSEAACKGPGVTVGRSGASVGVVSYIDEDYWPLNTCLYARDFHGNNPRFTYYFLKTLDLARLNSGSAQPSLNRNFVHPLPVTFPARLEQDSIASILGTLDDKINLNRRMNETLEAMARAIFKDWFVDFGPARAKMEGRAPYLAPEIWALFPDRLDDDGKPEGWECSTVGSEFRLTMGQSPPGDTYNETGDGLPFFQGRTDFGPRYPKRRMFCNAPTRVAEADDTLVSVRAPVGDLNMAWERCCIGRGVAAVRHRSGHRGYTYHMMSHLQPDLAAFEHTGTVFGAITKAQFEILKTISPNRRVVDAFEEVVSGFDERIRLNELGSVTLSSARDFLLPKLMSGEIRMKEAEKKVQAVA